MCLYKKHKWPKIAWKPIKVYKELEISASGSLRTPIMREPVELNKPIKAYKHWIHGINTKKIKAEGVHAYIGEGSACNTLYTVMFEAVIPRFSLYWLGRKGEIAATKMIVTRKVQIIGMSNIIDDINKKH